MRSSPSFLRSTPPGRRIRKDNEFARMPVFACAERRGGRSRSRRGSAATCPASACAGSRGTRRRRVRPDGNRSGRPGRAPISVSSPRCRLPWSRSRSGRKRKRGPTSGGLPVGRRPGRRISTVHPPGTGPRMCAHAGPGPATRLANRSRFPPASWFRPKASHRKITLSEVILRGEARLRQRWRREARRGRVGKCA